MEDERFCWLTFTARTLARVGSPTTLFFAVRNGYISVGISRIGVWVMQWLALDIGGANLKVADGLGYGESRPFALWKDSRRLSQELRIQIAQSPPCDHLAVTMTGELADCFESKSAGVQFILEAVREAADGRHTRVYLNNGALVTPQVAQSRPADVAAANWHALARFAARFVKHEPALLIDIGSTTCDLVPLVNGVPAAAGRTDTERLLHGELIYAGVERTPICAVVDKLPYRNQVCPVAREFFATTGDAFRLLAALPEYAAAHHTADGQPATRAASRVRMGRMLCADGEQFHHRDATIAAAAVAKAMTELIANGIQHVMSSRALQPAACIFAGVGEFIAKDAVRSLGWSGREVSLRRELGVAVSQCAPAHALAVLAREAAGL